VEGLADALRALVEAGHLPAAISFDAVRAATQRYLPRRGSGTNPPSDDLDAMQALAKQLAEIEAALVQLHRRRRVAGLVEAKAAARLAGQHIEIARRQVADGPRRIGRPPSPRIVLVWGLAAAIEDAGGEVDTSAAGGLGRLVRAALAAHGERLSDMGGLLRSAIDKRPKNLSH
jgi:hypothetical protein